MGRKLFRANFISWAILSIISVQGFDNSKASPSNPIDTLQDLSSRIITAANYSLPNPAALVQPTLPKLPGVPLLPGATEAQKNVTAALLAGSVALGRAASPEAAEELVSAVLASAPAPELADLVRNFTAAAAAPAPSLGVSLPGPAPSPRAYLLGPAGAPIPAPVPAPGAAALVTGSATAEKAAAPEATASAQQPFSLNASLAAVNASAASAVRSFQAAASSAVSAATGGNATELPILALPSRPNATSMSESKAIGNLVASSVQLGADLAASGHAVSLAADERASFAAKLRGDFESISLAIANLPVGLIPFPDKAKAALQKLNTDVVHGVTTGNLDIAAISADKDAVAAALAPVTQGTTANFDKLQ